MTKSDLIKRLAEANPHLFMRDIERIVGTVFEQMGPLIKKGSGCLPTPLRPSRQTHSPRSMASDTPNKAHDCP